VQQQGREETSLTSLELRYAFFSSLSSLHFILLQTHFLGTTDDDHQCPLPPPPLPTMDDPPPPSATIVTTNNAVPACSPAMWIMDARSGRLEEGEWERHHHKQLFTGWLPIPPPRMTMMTWCRHNQLLYLNGPAIAGLPRSRSCW
jgi:hypothetical protein